MLRDIVFRTDLDLFHRALLGDSPARVESMTVGTPGETAELGGSVANMAHEPLVYLSGHFRGSQERWATVDKEGFAIVST